MKLNLANSITGFRILAIPLCVLLFYLPIEWGRKAAALIFAAAAISDFFDGWIARRFNQMTPFGAFLDPVADKLIVAVALVLLVQAEASIPMALIAAIIIGREITVSALREWMASQSASATVAVEGMEIGFGVMIAPTSGAAANSDMSAAAVAFAARTSP